MNVDCQEPLMPQGPSGPQGPPDTIAELSKAWAGCESRMQLVNRIRRKQWQRFFENVLIWLFFVVLLWVPLAFLIWRLVE